MVTKFNPLEKAKPPEKKKPVGTVVDPYNPEESLAEGQEDLEPEEEAAPTPGLLTPAELQQDPDELLSEENDDGTEQQDGGGSEPDRS